MPSVPSVAVRESPVGASAFRDEAIRSLLLNSFNEALVRLAERPGGIESLSDQEIDQRVTEAILDDLSDYLGVSRKEAAAILVEMFNESEAQPDSPLARVRRIAAGIGE
jgi:hypothetical protein